MREISNNTMNGSLMTGISKKKYIREVRGMKRYIYVAYGIDMEIDYAVVEVFAYNQEQAMNAAIVKFELAGIDCDTIELFDEEFMKRCRIL